ncbi:MutS family domain IV protein, partial [Bordetella bronchiseptica E012]
PRELASLRDALVALPALHASLAPLSGSPRARELAAQLAMPPDIGELLARAVASEPAVAIRDGGVIAAGFDSELDELRALATDGGDFLVQLEARERERTGNGNLSTVSSATKAKGVEFRLANLNGQHIRMGTDETTQAAQTFTGTEVTNGGNTTKSYTLRYLASYVKKPNEDVDAAQITSYVGFSVVYP